MNTTPGIRCSIIRGGTSKGVYFRDRDLPPDPEERDALLLRVFGSPDPRQIDGLGGADPLTSKCVIVGRGDAGEFDLTYEFAQIGISEAHVDYGSVCGNLSSGLGYFAADRGMIECRGASVKTRVKVVNNDAWLEVETPLRHGRPTSEGGFSIAGVPGTGAQVIVNLAGLAGARLGSVFPTGNRIDVLDVDGVGPVRATLMDVGNPHIFVRAADVGFAGTELPQVISETPAAIERLEHIREVAAATLGLVASPERARVDTPAVPILGLVAQPQDHMSANGDQLLRRSHDVVARLLFMQSIHKAYAATSTACTGVAARTPGTVVSDMVTKSDGDDSQVRIGHPGGIITTDVTINTIGDDLTMKAEIEVVHATISRTARIIASGRAWLD